MDGVGEKQMEMCQRECRAVTQLFLLNTSSARVCGLRIVQMLPVAIGPYHFGV
jgi:hypothetical protein